MKKMYTFTFSPLKRTLLTLLLLFGSLIATWMFSSTPAHAAMRAGNSTIILVHGFNFDDNGSSGGFDCTDHYNYGWGTVLDYLRGSHDINGQQ